MLLTIDPVCFLLVEHSSHALYGGSFLAGGNIVQ